jgi:hypothetical protein
MNRPKYIVVHCTDISYKISTDQYKSVNDYHRDVREFPVSRSGSYVGYHALITGGLTYRPRQDDEMGAHCNQEFDGKNIWPVNTGKATSMNLQSLGVCIGFDGDMEYPSQADAIRLRNQCHEWMDKYGISIENVYFHRNFAANKSCPGSLITKDWLYQLLKRVPKTPMKELEIPTADVNNFVALWRKLFNNGQS